MNKNKWKEWVAQICTKSGFRVREMIQEAHYGSEIRNQIFTGLYKKQPAILKVYDDPRLSDEPLVHASFLKLNRSKILRAPKLYRYEVISPRRGWLIMERLENGAFLSQPLSAGEREKFLELYLEYRKHFPARSIRPLSLIEKLPAGEFHLFRIMRWMELANNKECEIKFKHSRSYKEALNPKEFIPILEKAIAIIREEFSRRRKMIYCHGHFKPHDIFKSNNGVYYLTDFAHARMYPEGYELAFIVWADQMMDASWNVEYRMWRRGIFDWLSKMKSVGKALGIRRFRSLMKAALAERIIGTLLADVTASDRPRREKLTRIQHLRRLFVEIIR